jgi:hypothetical protein
LKPAVGDADCYGVMPRHEFDYQSPIDAPQPGRVRGAIAIVSGIVILVNAGLLAAAASNRSWGAFGIAVVFGPITNGVLALVAGACAPSVKRVSGGASVAVYVLVSILLPVVAILADFAITGSIGVHGS